MAENLATYLTRRTLMLHSQLLHENARVLVRERHLRAEAERSASRLVTVRRWQRIVYKTH
jgi:hypothetical protein